MALQPLFFGWETDKLVFVVWQGRCPGRAQKFTVGKNEVWEALEYPGYRTVWTEKERPGSILLPLTPNCVLLSKVPHPSGPLFPISSIETRVKMSIERWCGVCL